MQITEAEYNDQIRILSGMANMGSEVARLTKERDAIYGKKGTPVASGDMITLDMTPEEWEKAGSKFAGKGLHVSEFGMPAWHTAGVSLDFPFTIVDGPNKGIEGTISAGVSKGAAWKIKELLTALKVDYTKTATGQVAFNPADVAGKKAYTQWDETVDSRTPEEGGKGTTYTKPTKAVKIE